MAKGDYLRYTITGDTAQVDKYENFDPHGVGDVNNATIDRRISADETLQVGEIFDLGWSRAVVVSRPREIWRSGVKHEYYLRVTEPGLTYRVNLMPRSRCRLRSMQSEGSGRLCFKQPRLPHHGNRPEVHRLEADHFVPQRQFSA